MHKRQMDFRLEHTQINNNRKKNIIYRCIVFFWSVAAFVFLFVVYFGWSSHSHWESTSAAQMGESCLTADATTFVCFVCPARYRGIPHTAVRSFSFIHSFISANIVLCCVAIIVRMSRLILSIFSLLLLNKPKYQYY